MSRRQETDEMFQGYERSGGSGLGPPPTYDEALRLSDHKRNGQNQPGVIETNLDEVEIEDLADDDNTDDEGENSELHPLMEDECIALQATAKGTGDHGGEKSQDSAANTRGQFLPTVSSSGSEMESDDDVPSAKQQPPGGASAYAPQPSGARGYSPVPRGRSPMAVQTEPSDEGKAKRHSARWQTRHDDIGREESFELEMMNVGGDSEEDEESVHGSRTQMESEVSPGEVTLDFPREQRRRTIDVEEFGSQVGTTRSESRASRDYECSTFPMLTPVYSYLRKAWDRTSGTKRILILLAVVGVLGLLLFVSLFPASFVYVDYYEMGFSRNKVSGVHDYSEVYQTGCYLLAPQDEIVTFKATAHHLVLDLSVLNAMGVEMGLQATAQYFLKPEELHQLFKKYHRDYPAIIYSVAESTIKNGAVHLSMELYRLNRTFVEAQLFKQLKKALGGDCCPTCVRHQTRCGQGQDCQTTSCSTGYHVDLRYFQLGKITVPSLVMDLYLKTATLKIDAEREYHVQSKALRKKVTEYKVQRELNTANEIRKVAEAKRRVIISTAQAAKERDVQKAYITVLKQLFDRLNISSQEEQTSFMYFKALKDASENLYTSYNFAKESLFSP